MYMETEDKRGNGSTILVNAAGELRKDLGIAFVFANRG